MNRATFVDRDDQGQRLYRVPVRVVITAPHSRDFREQVFTLTVTANSAAAAANYIRDRYAWPEYTNIYAYGPRGSVVHRYIGMESMIARTLFGGAGVNPQRITEEYDVTFRR